MTPAILLWLAAAPIHYVDVWARSNLAYVSNNNFTGRKYFPQPMCGGVAILDFDNDGLADIFLTNGATLPQMKKTDPAFRNTLLRNKGEGSFEDATRRGGVSGENLGFSFGAAAGDFDNDGWTDLFVANAGANALYRNNGNGTFTDVTATAGLTKPAGTLSVQGAWVDYDNDGRLDLVLSNYTMWTPETDRRCTREDGVDFYCHPKSYPTAAQRLYRNLGGGKFQDVTEASGFGRTLGKGMGIGIADFNGDGWPDVFIANDTEPNLLFLNRANGTFAEQALPMGVAYNEDASIVSAMGADARDFDNDGWPDIFYNNLIGQTWALFRNRVGKSFQYVSPATRLVTLTAPYSGWSANFIDYDNDGWKDIFSANGDVDSLRPGSEQHDTMFRNVDGRHFVDVSGELGKDFLRAGYQRGAAISDLNNDGFPDIVVTSLNRAPRILINSATNGHHWLTFLLTGRQSNRDAIGARVKVTTPSGRTLYDHVTTSTGFLSSSDRRVHFGLGQETKAASVEIRWPRGAVTVLSELAADRQVAVIEPGAQ